MFRCLSGFISLLLIISTGVVSATDRRNRKDKCEKELRYLPYAEARESVRKYGIDSREEFIRHRQVGMLPPGVPKNPDIYYRRDWKSWDAFVESRPGRRKVGPVTFTFVEAKAYAQANGIRTALQWRDSYADGKLPAGMPLSPWVAYAKEWVSTFDFFGKEDELPAEVLFSFAQASEWAQANGIQMVKQWASLYEEGKLPEGMPKYPDRAYAYDWVGWASFLGKTLPSRE